MVILLTLWGAKSWCPSKPENGRISSCQFRESKDIDREERVPLIHNRRVIKTNLMLIARSLMEFDVSDYTSVAARCFDYRINTIYVIVWRTNIPWAKSTVKAIEGMGKYAKFVECTFQIIGQQNRFQSNLAVLMNVGEKENISPVTS
jgi:hypothetical protein